MPEAQVSGLLHIRLSGESTLASAGSKFDDDACKHARKASSRAGGLRGWLLRRPGLVPLLPVSFLKPRCGVWGI